MDSIASGSVDIFKNDHINIDIVIFEMCWFIDYWYVLSIYWTPLSSPGDPYPIHYGATSIWDGVFYWVLLRVFYLLNAFAGLANPPAELPEGGCGLLNWKSWMKYPETHSLEVTLQKGREGILCLQSFRNNFFILRIRLLSFLEKGKISSLCHHLEISQGRITLENFLYNCVSTTISNTILSPAPSGN